MIKTTTIDLTSTKQEHNNENKKDIENQTITTPTTVDSTLQTAGDAGNSKTDKTELTQEENDDDSPAPLWPKTEDEWVWLVTELIPVGLAVAGLTKECPAIPSMKAFLVAFSVETTFSEFLKFGFSLRRPTNPYLNHKLFKALGHALFAIRLAIGIWGMTIVFPNMRYLTNPSFGTCERTPMLAALIPSCIVALILALIALMLVAIVVRRILVVCGCITDEEDDDKEIIEENKAGEEAQVTPQHTDQGDFEMTC